MSPASPLQAQIAAHQSVSTHVELARARLGSALRTICDIRGFSAAAEIVQAELRSLQGERQEAGHDQEGWIG